MNNQMNIEGKKAILSVLKGKNLRDITNLIKQGETIVLAVKNACILVEKFDWGYEVNIIDRLDNKWEIMKCDDYSLKVTLAAIFQSPQIRKTVMYSCRCNDNFKKPYIEIADALILEENKGKEVIEI